MKEQAKAAIITKKLTMFGTISRHNNWDSRILMQDQAQLKPSKIHGKFDWTKIHLVYFVLGAFDLLAIISGLALSEWSKNAHIETVQKLAQTNFLRDEITLEENFGMKISAITNDLFKDMDANRGKSNLNILKIFGNDLSKPEIFIDKLNMQFPFIDRTVEVEAGATDIELNFHRRLNKLDPQVLHGFEETKQAISVSIQNMLDETKIALNAFGLNNRESAARHMNNSNRELRLLLESAFAYSAKLDIEMHKTVKQSEVTLNRSTLLQYLVGGLIFIMIGMGSAYAFYVGRVLRSKYVELQKAHDESVEHSTMIQNVNEGVTKLNVELADNMKRLSEAQDELIKKGRMEQLGQLTATVAHELRNPLGAVRTSSFLLERKLRDKGLGVEAQLQRISTGVTRCDNIISQLLDFSRTNKLVCQMGDLDLWLIKTVEEAAKQLPEMVAITCELGLDEKQVPFDDARMERAIINLISNASEAMVGNGQDPSKIVTVNPQITIATRLIGNSVQISVTDNGPGMSPEILDKVREPLFTTKSFGTGLGISAIEQIAYQHGGKLDISSVEGQGSVFTVTLPMPLELAEAS